MSATIKWEMVKPHGKSLKVFTPSAFIEAMERAFGQFPIVLDNRSIGKLEGMACVWNNEPNPYRELINILDGLGENQSIKIWAEY